MMPEVDGLDILRYVRSNTQLADLPVISECKEKQLQHTIGSWQQQRASTPLVRCQPLTCRRAATATACSDVCQRAEGHCVSGHQGRC